MDRMVHVCTRPAAHNARGAAWEPAGWAILGQQMGLTMPHPKGRLDGQQTNTTTYPHSPVHANARVVSWKLAVPAGICGQAQSQVWGVSGGQAQSQMWGVSGCQKQP